MPSRPSQDGEVLWRPQNPGNTSMDRYRQHINQRFNQNLQDSFQLHQWSVDNPQEFWIDLYKYLPLKPDLDPSTKTAYDASRPMSSIPPFFPGHEINYAENALFANPDSDAVALVGLREGIPLDDHESLTWRQVRDQVRLAASALRRIGVQKGDRVAALVATSIPAMILFHAAASIGAIFTSVSPDLGLAGCISRFQQVTPRILFADSDIVWKGKTTPTSTKVQEIVKALSSSPPQVFIVPIVSKQTVYPTLDDFMAKADRLEPLTFLRVPFNHPLMICYSSGTTGAPKCIVHQHGIIMQLRKIAAVHNGTTPSDVILQYSSTSWVVFYVMCGYFACGAKTLLYNGSPMYPNVKVLLRTIEYFRVTYFGTSPRFLLELEMTKTVPKRDFNLDSLRITYTTGATLSPDQYRWFYASFPPHIHLCNTAGGTDTSTSLIAADPSSPIHAGEMQIFGLGMSIDILDASSSASLLHVPDPTPEAGEMVITAPFPSMPCYFYNDPSGKIYHEAYFSRFEPHGLDVWAQADWLSRNPKTGGLVMHGRSDGVLNPSGIRFGSGEIYAVVEAPPLNTRIRDSLCVGRRRAQDRDEDVFLFVVLDQGERLDEGFIKEIKGRIREALSARHVPKFVVQVPEVPVTINGKKVEAAVKQTLSGRDVVPSNTVANPKSIAFFKRFRGLEREPREAKL